MGDVFLRQNVVAYSKNNQTLGFSGVNSPLQGISTDFNQMSALIMIGLLFIIYLVMICRESQVKNLIGNQVIPGGNYART